jgi:tetratricopeptide (TPR) repeat protein
MRRSLVIIPIVLVVGVIVGNAIRANAANLLLLHAIKRSTPPFELCGELQVTLGSDASFVTRGADPRNVGFLRLRAGDLVAARMSFEERLAAVPGDVAARLGVAKGLSDDGRTAEAAMQMRMLPYSDASARLVALGQRAASRRGATAGLQCTALAVAVSPNSAMARAAHGEILQRSGRSTEALQYLDAAISTDPELGRAYLYRAFARIALAWPAEKVEDDFRRAVLVTPNDFDVRYARANWIASNGRTSEAISGYERLLRLFPGQQEVKAAIVRLRAAH